MTERRDFLKAVPLGVVGLAMADPLGLLLKKPEPTPGAWLEFDEQGIPYRASTQPASPYYYSDAIHKLRVTIDGKTPGACIGYDRKRGFVECRPVVEKCWWYRQGYGWPHLVPPTDPRRWDIVRHYGKIEVGRA